MIPWERLDAVTLEDGVELKLMRRGGEYSIMLGANELMNSRLSGSEEALAACSIAQLGGTPAPRILIGGLGMGFTLRAALGLLGPESGVTVAELVPEVIEWARGPMAPVFAGCLDDPRVRLFEGDVGELIRTSQGAWDAILLDVDNGPEGLTRRGNDALYSAQGLAGAKRALAKGGVYSVWSSAPDPAFTRRLRQAGFTVEERATRASTRKRGARHMIWLATTP
ncbi:MAG: spermidine synthase [Hoeflea sp.]|uniref:spermidine synthase n=1 Tax=Hoeflea sp. TaxID=1940281 RepID=UPI0032EA9D8F